MNQPINIALTPEEYAARRQTLAAKGIKLPDGDSGALSYQGVTVQCSYNGADTLTITVTQKPWIISESYVENKIRAWFAEAPKEG